MTDSGTLWMVLFVVAAAAAAYFCWQHLDASRKLNDAREKLSKQERQAAEAEVRLQHVETITAERDAARTRAEELSAKLAAETASGQARAVAAAEKEQALLALKTEVEKSFETLANRALGQSQQSFLNLANETFEKHKVAAAGSVKEVVGPVQEQFAKLSETIATLDKARTEDKSAVTEQMRLIGETLQRTQSETSKLVMTLRASPKTRGRWGEETLRNVLEMSGLSPHADFSEQSTHTDDDGRMLRPDVIIRLPGGRSIIVDAKVALSGYLDAMEATDEALREAHLKKHAAELRAHVKALSSKDYSKYVGDSADFVALFIPGENFFAAAVERDATLFEDAMKARVVIVTPVTLMALARSISYGWRQEQSAKNAQEIADLGRELYRRLVTMTEHLGKVGDAIGKSVTTYNSYVASMESRVLPQAKRFKDLGAAEGSAEIADSTTIDTAPRLPAPQAELDLPPPKTKGR